MSAYFPCVGRSSQSSKHTMAVHFIHNIDRPATILGDSELSSFRWLECPASKASIPRTRPDKHEAYYMCGYSGCASTSAAVSWRPDLIMVRLFKGYQYLDIHDCDK